MSIEPQSGRILMMLEAGERVREAYKKVEQTIQNQERQLEASRERFDEIAKAIAQGDSDKAYSLALSAMGSLE